LRAEESRTEELRAQESRSDDDKEERSKLESELRELQTEADELTAILDTATDGIALIDAQGRILALNRSAEALFGYDQGAVQNEPFSMLLAPESHAKLRQYFEGLQSGGVASLLNDGREVLGKARQGGTIPLFLTLGRVGVASASQPQKFCALLRDMTHWKKVEDELNAARKEAERASAAKSDFLAKVSHEIRTPLNAIIGFAEVIMEERFGAIGNDRYRDYLKDIHSSGAHVMSLVNDLLDLSKIEAGRMDLDFVAVDTNKIITECVGLMQPQANRERIIMRLALSASLPKILADERALKQIVLNLLSNAVKFNEPGGQVIVATAIADDGQAVIRIRDTGIGMSDDDIKTALEPFRQLATARQTAGTGLGLPLTKAMVEANRASFTIKSKKNEGTLVEIAFPPARHLSRDPLSA
jgi:PAS domain S-box-containing protein